MAERNPVDALEFVGANPEALTIDPHNTFYAGLLRRHLQLGNNVVFDPDFVLEADPDAYQKIVAELTIAAKLRKRAERVGSASWRIHTEDQEKLGLCELLTDIFKRIYRFRVALKSLIFNSNLKGFSTLRIFGEFENTMLRGDFGARRWWLPTNLVDVAKERWRINREQDINVEQGFPRYFWAVQDILTYDWYRLDAPGSIPGLRRLDYVWAKASEDETDLGYAHGLGRGLFHKWFMLTHNWIYAMDGAESWSKGKVVISHPNSLGGATIPGDSDLRAQRQAQELRDEVARAAAEQLSRHVLVLDSGQEFQVFARPESGHESVKWLIEKIDKELDEYILGVRAGENRKWDVDPEIINADKNTLEDAINDDLMRAVVLFNADNFRALGWEPQEVLECKWVMQRDNFYDPEQLGKNIQIALAAGVPVHRNDIYQGLGLTPVNPESEDAVWAPQPGQPVSGVNLRAPGEGVEDRSVDENGSPVPNPGSGAPSPGGPFSPSIGGDIQVTL